MAKTLPPMLEVMKEIGGVEFPESFAKIAGQNRSASDANSAQETTESDATSDSTLTVEMEKQN